MTEIDLALFRAINGWPDGQAPFWRFWSDATNLNWVRVLLLVLVIGMLCRGPRSRVAIVLAMLAWPIANELCDFWKDGLRDPRPFQVLPDVLMRAGRSDSFGTASAHSANMAAIAAVMFARMGRWGWIWLAVAFFTGLSRIYVGVHFPRQVVLGWGTGAVAGLALVWLFGRWESRRKPTPDASLPEPEASS